MIDPKQLGLRIASLDDSDKEFIKTHLKSLSTTDRYMRFWATISDSVIDKYVDNLDLKNSKGFGIYGEGGEKLVAFVHVSEVERNGNHNRAELGISVDENYRELGLARRLMDRSVNYCKANDIDTLFISCLRENKKMQRMATNAGLRVVLDHDEAIAELKLDEMELQKATAISQEIAYEQIAIFDKCYRHNPALVAALLKE